MKKEKKPMSAGKILLLVFGSFLALIMILTACFIYDLNHPKKPIKSINDDLIESIYERCELRIPDSADLIWGAKESHMDGMAIYLFFTVPEEDFEAMLDGLQDKWVPDDIEYYSSSHSQPPDAGGWELDSVMEYTGNLAYIKYSDPKDGKVAIYFYVL